MAVDLTEDDAGQLPTGSIVPAGGSASVELLPTSHAGHHPSGPSKSGTSGKLAAAAGGIATAMRSMRRSSSISKLAGKAAEASDSGGLKRHNSTSALAVGFVDMEVHSLTMDLPPRPSSPVGGLAALTCSMGKSSSTGTLPAVATSKAVPFSRGKMATLAQFSKKQNAVDGTFGRSAQLLGMRTVSRGLEF